MSLETIAKILFVIGLLFMAGGYYTQTRVKAFLDRAVSVPGKVIRLDRTSDDTFQPIVEWVDHAGVTQTLRSGSSSNPPSFHAGEDVTVLYDPADPEYSTTARINSTMNIWGVAGFFYIFGAAWSLIAGGSWYMLVKSGGA